MAINNWNSWNLIALLMPYIGTLADSVKNGRLTLLRLFTVICIVQLLYSGLFCPHQTTSFLL